MRCHGNGNQTFSITFKTFNGFSQAWPDDESDVVQWISPCNVTNNLWFVFSLFASFINCFREDERAHAHAHTKWMCLCAWNTIAHYSLHECVLKSSGVSPFLTLGSRFKMPSLFRFVCFLLFFLSQYCTHTKHFLSFSLTLYFSCDSTTEIQTDKLWKSKI